MQRPSRWTASGRVREREENRKTRAWQAVPWPVEGSKKPELEAAACLIAWKSLQSRVYIRQGSANRPRLVAPEGKTGFRPGAFVFLGPEGGGTGILKT